MSNKTLISLFSGCGGSDLGFIDEGFRILSAYDCDENVVETYKRNIGDHIINLDLSTENLPQSPSSNVDVVFSGSPCQGFSTAGKRKISDPRNSLLISAGKIALKIRPKVFIAENVPGVIAGEHKKYWSELENLMLSNGYKVESILCDASQMGLAQMRKRMIMLAWRTRKDPSLDIPKKPPLVLTDVLNKLDGINNHSPIFFKKNSDVAQIAKSIKAGQKLCNVRAGERSVPTWTIPEVFGKITKDEVLVLETLRSLRRKLRIRDYGDADPVTARALGKYTNVNVSRILQALIKKGYVCKKGNAYDLKHTYNGLYRRLELNSQSYTVDTRFGNPRFFLHPVEDRGFTVREAARIQGFSDDYIFQGTEAEKFRMVGNAFPPPMSRCIANIVKGRLL